MVLAIIGVAVIIAGQLQAQGSEGWYIEEVSLGLGLAILVLTVVFPAIREVEFGFPSGVKISAAFQNREEELGKAFESQKGDLELYAQLLCEDPALSADLLEAAWAKTAATWRGPVTPELRFYVLCLFVHLLDSHHRWVTPVARNRPPGDGGPVSTTPLNALSLDERIVVVLREFVDLPSTQIAALTGRPLAAVRQDLQTARAVLDQSNGNGGSP
ncbi:RNA polymerase sigma factor [Kocuria sp. LHG3120]|uniref:RNA polymerase sigma factor n=1 Tax=Kocuria sp. LHG3120 TaxID=2804590 RepID=UPI003CE92BBE